MKPAYPDSRSLIAEWRQHAPQGTEVPPREKEAEKAASLREYQKLVNQINDVVREQEIQRRSGSR
jgi:hypothetical protein